MTKPSIVLPEAVWIHLIRFRSPQLSNFQHNYPILKPTILILSFSLSKSYRSFPKSLPNQPKMKALPTGDDKALAIEKEPSSTATVAEGTWAGAFPDDVFLQYIAKPTFGDHPFMYVLLYTCCGWLLVHQNTSVMMIYFLIMTTYFFRCEDDCCSTFCVVVSYAFAFVLFSPMAFLLYVWYKRQSLESASAHESVSKTDAM